MEELLNIWNAGDELNDDELLKYAQGKLAEGEKHDVEKKMMRSAFVNDAAEGLHEFSSTEKVNSYVQQLNEQLHKKLTEKKQKTKRPAINISWQIIAVVTILILCLLAFVIIQMLKK